MALRDIKRGGSVGLGDLYRLQDKYKELEEERDGLLKKVDELQEKLNEASREEKKSNKANTSYKRFWILQKKKADDLQKEVKSLKATLKKMQKSLDAATQKITALKGYKKKAERKTKKQ